jgi:hypothetical protein
MASTSPEYSNSYTRRLIGEYAERIESTCVRCGCKIVASVTDGLPEKEQSHYEQCIAGGRDPGGSMQHGSV